jgi:diguanylate cyclase (GGDEF)-like protein
MIWQGHDARELARHDPLTGLLSRAGFDSRLSETINTAKRRRHGFAVIAIDLDGFKAINDRFGHHIGDDVIREVGARIRAGIRLTDAGVRRGGDEYGVLLADVDSRQTAESVARRLLTSITKPIRAGGRDLRVGASFGVLIVEPDADIPRIVDIHRTTDALMYEAKAIPGGRRARVARASRGEGSMQVEVLAPEPEGADAPAGTDLVA